MENCMSVFSVSFVSFLFLVQVKLFILRGFKKMKTELILQVWSKVPAQPPNRNISPAKDLDKTEKEKKFHFPSQKFACARM